MSGVLDETLWGLLDVPHDGVATARGASTGSTAWVTDTDIVLRFVAKCSPHDDQGHRWWLGAVDGGMDRSGGYGRFQAGLDDDAVIITAHRYAWTLERGPVPMGL